MQIIVVLLVLLFLSIMLPLLLPILSIAVVVILVLNLRRMFSPKNYRRFEEDQMRQDKLNQEGETELEFREQKGSAKGYQLPRSVKDDAFWEQEHQVLDVPYEEAEDAENSDNAQNKEDSNV